jgi:hypothetical protein
MTPRWTAPLHVHLGLMPSVVAKISWRALVLPRNIAKLARAARIVDTRQPAPDPQRVAAAIQVKDGRPRSAAAARLILLEGPPFTPPGS